MVGGGISEKGVVGAEGMTFCSERVNCNFFFQFTALFLRAFDSLVKGDL